ncbi:MAG: nuclear transport factor 2 family protein [Pedobacter sp.]|nr:MAG: nuclear transport factor 2 family protein [Pedobacter sp.]
MKRISILALLLSFTMAVTAQTKAESELTTAVENLRLAMISGDRTALESVASKDLSYGHSSGKVEDFNAFVETLVSGKSDFVTIDFAKQTVKVSGDVGLVRHELHAKTNDGGKPGEVHIGIFLAWKKEGKVWRMVGRQAYKLP